MTISDESKSLLLRAASVTADEQNLGWTDHQKRYIEAFANTAENELANSRRIAGENADLFAIANKAVEEVRALVDEWIGPDNPDALTDWRAMKLREVLGRFDAALKETIR